MTKRDLVVASTRHHLHLARLLKYYPRRPCAPSLIKSRFFTHTTNLLTVLTFLHFEIPYMYTRGETLGAFSGFCLWAKTLRGQWTVSTQPSVTFRKKTLNAVLNDTWKKHFGIIISSDRFIYYILNIISIYNWSLTIFVVIQAIGHFLPRPPSFSFFPVKRAASSQSALR